MNFSLKSLSLVFAAGVWGALWNSLAVWFFGLIHFTTALGVHIAPRLTPAFLYPRLVWGGLWGFLFLLPLGRMTLPRRGLLLSLGPTLVQLLWVFPLKAHKGYWGLALGVLTPAFVVFFNVVWGLAAGYWLKWSRTN
jgi:hypothetical protein